jgi:hypothetical protein
MRITESRLRRIIREVIKEASDASTLQYISSKLGSDKPMETLKLMMGRHVLNHMTGLEKERMSCEEFVESLFGEVESGVYEELIAACKEGEALAKEVNMTKEERMEKAVGHFPSAR